MDLYSKSCYRRNGRKAGMPAAGPLRPWPEVARMYQQLHPRERKLSLARYQQIAQAAERKLRRALDKLMGAAT